jgi:hypothetical protein
MKYFSSKKYRNVSLDLNTKLQITKQDDKGELNEI